MTRKTLAVLFVTFAATLAISGQRSEVPGVQGGSGVAEDPEQLAARPGGERRRSTRRITCGCCSVRERSRRRRNRAPRRRCSSSTPPATSSRRGAGPGEGYEWPNSEHGVYVDPKGFVWIGGNGDNDHQILKFTKTGKFVMQIGRAGKSKGNADTGT